MTSRTELAASSRDGHLALLRAHDRPRRRAAPGSAEFPSQSERRLSNGQDRAGHEPRLAGHQKKGLLAHAAD